MPKTHRKIWDGMRDRWERNVLHVAPNGAKTDVEAFGAINMTSLRDFSDTLLWTVGKGSIGRHRKGASVG